MAFLIWVTTYMNGVGTGTAPTSMPVHQNAIRVGPAVELAVPRAVAPGGTTSRSAEPPRAPAFRQSSNIPTTVFAWHDHRPCKIVVVPRLLECSIAGIAGSPLLRTETQARCHNHAYTYFSTTNPSVLHIPLPASLSILHPSIPRSYIPFFAGYPPPVRNGIRPHNNKSFSLRCPVRAPQRLAR